MNNAPRIAMAAALASALAGLAATSTAEAATERIQYISASAVCEAVDPSNFTGLRFRSIGVYNASDANIQVACGVPTEYVGDQATGQVTVSVHNFRDSASFIKCTVHAGNRWVGVNSYPATINVSANSQTNFSFSNVDKNTPGNYTHYNLTCIIPPRFELSTIRWQEFDEDDGL